LAVAHDHVPVNSGGKQMNEDSNNMNKDTIESKVESKQIAQDI
jgi:tudor domain-containing protein 3